MGDEPGTAGSPPSGDQAAGTAARSTGARGRGTGGPASVATVVEPPDGGWAWLVLLGTFLVLVSIIGYLVAMSVFFVAWREEFQASAAAVSLVISTGSFVRGVSSPPVGLLFTKFSGRAVLMAGALISSVGILLTSFCTTVPYLVCASGIIAAFGHSCCFNAAHAMLRCYFKKHYSLAVGLTHAGVSAGQLAYPPLFTWLLSGYGWRGALLIISAINMNLLVVGALMRPVRARPSTSKAKATREVEGDLNELEASSDDQTSTKVEQREDCHDVRDDVVVPTGGSDQKVTESESDAKVSEDVTSLPMGVRGDEGTVAGRTPGQCPCLGRLAPCLRRTRTFLLDTYGLRRLAGNLSFLLVCGVAFLTAYGFACVSVHLVPRMEYVGLDRGSASLLLSVVGGAGLVSRPVVGLCLDRGSLTSEATYGAAMVVTALACSLVPQFTAFAPLVAVMVAMGTAGGICGSVIMVLMYNAVQLAEAAAATGILILAWGLGEVAGGFFAGFLFDWTGIYDYSFYSAGATAVIGGFLSLSIHFRLIRRKKSPGARRTNSYCADNPGFAGDNDNAPTAPFSEIPMTETAVDRVTEPTRVNEDSEETEAVVHGCSQEDMSTQTVSCEENAPSKDIDVDDPVVEGALQNDPPQVAMGEVHKNKLP